MPMMLWVMQIIMKMDHTMTKKKKKVSSYEKTTERMNRETARAIAHVKMLEELYESVQKQRKSLLTKNL